MRTPLPWLAALLLAGCWWSAEQVPCETDADCPFALVCDPSLLHAETGLNACSEVLDDDADDDDDATDDDDVVDDDDIANEDDASDDDDTSDDDDDMADDDDSANDDDAGDDDDDATAAETALGYVHDQETVLTIDYDIQTDMWVRVAEGGEAGQDSFELRPGLYSAGPNGLYEQGRNDDVLVESLDISEVTVTEGPWAESEEVDPNGPSYPSGHYNEGDPTVYAGGGIFQAGVDTGNLPVTISHPDHDSIETNVQVLPPDWYPLGEHDGSFALGYCL